MLVVGSFWCVEVFNQFYQTKVKGRKLSWVHSLGSCHIDGKFGQKTIEIIVGTYQTAALLLFNTADRLSYTEIAGQLNLDDGEMIRVLQSLSCEKYKILLKEPNTKTVSHTDQFSFNSGFTDRMRKIMVPLPPLDEIAEREKIVEEADTDRQLAIETSIVRIMKCRMKLGHQQLITECFEQLSRMFEKFQPDHKAIEEKIESLINREYIERDKENPQLLRYVP